MCSVSRIRGRVLRTTEAAEKLSNISLDAGNLSKATHIFSLKYPSGAAITNSDVRKCSIRYSFQAIIELEAV